MIFPMDLSTLFGTPADCHNPEGLALQDLLDGSGTTQVESNQASRFPFECLIQPRLLVWSHFCLLDMEMYVLSLDLKKSSKL